MMKKRKKFAGSEKKKTMRIQAHKDVIVYKMTVLHFEVGGERNANSEGLHKI